MGGAEDVTEMVGGVMVWLVELAARYGKSLFCLLCPFARITIKSKASSRLYLHVFADSFSSVQKPVKTTHPRLRPF